MSMLTRCPACTTIYRVVPDQLRISQGWVKCGQCGDIFDATQHLVQIEPEAPADAGPAADVHDASLQAEQEPLPEPDSHDQTPAAEASPMDAGPVATDVSGLDDPGALRDQASAEMPAVDVDKLAEEALGATANVSGALQDTATADAPAQWAPMRESAIDDETDPPPMAPSEPVTAESVPTPELTQVSFMRAGRASSRWHRSGVRAALLAVAVLLVIVLALQWIYRQRDWLVAAFPQVQPIVQAVCAASGCRVQPLQQIESVVIDAAAFNKIEDGRYVLSCVVKNTAPWPLAAPSLELTLSDLQDRIVVRRVFAPHELDASVMMLSPLSEWRVNTPLTLALAQTAPAIVGYRVRVFYP